MTSVRIDSEVFELGREEGYNFSKLLENAIRERSDPKKEIMYIEGIITRLEKEITEYKSQLKALNLAEEKVNITLFDELVEQAKPEYMIHGYVPDRLLNRYSRKLGVNIQQLEEDVIYEISK